MLPGETGDYYSRLQQANNALRDAQLELRELENRREDLDRQLEGEEPVFIASGSQQIAISTPFDQRILNLQLELDEIKLKESTTSKEFETVSRKLEPLYEELESARTSYEKSKERVEHLEIRLKASKGTMG